MHRLRRYCDGSIASLTWWIKVRSCHVCRHDGHASRWVRSRSRLCCEISRSTAWKSRPSHLVHGDDASCIDDAFQGFQDPGAILALGEVLAHRDRLLLLQLALEVKAEKIADVGARGHHALPSAALPAGGTARIWTRRRTEVASSRRARLRRDLTVPSGSSVASAGREAIDDLGVEPRGFTFAPAPAVSVDDQVLGHPPGPGHEVGACLVTVKILPELEVDLLAEFLGLGGRGGVACAETINGAQGGAHQCAPCVLVALATTLDSDFQFSHIHSHPLQTESEGQKFAFFDRNVMWE